jgi:hypothetical protein
LDEVNVGYAEACTMSELDDKINRFKEYHAKNPDKVKALLWYSGNELNEGGQTIVPKLRRDGSIDSSVLDTISKHLD